MAEVVAAIGRISPKISRWTTGGGDRVIRFRLGALVATVALVFAACGGTATPVPSAVPNASTAISSPSTAAQPSTTAESPTPSGGQPVNGGTWGFGVVGPPLTLDAILVQDGESYRIDQEIYETLIKLKPGTASDLEPSLAKSWDVSPDGLTYTFHLQTGVNFTDGTPFNADAAIYNFNRWKNLPEPLRSADYFDITVFGGYGDSSLIKTLTKIDDATFSVTLTKPKSDFLTTMTLISFGMMSPTARQAHPAALPPTDPTNDYWQKAPTGTGPFMFSEFVPGDHYTIVKNPNYWDTAGAAHLDKIIFLPIANSANRLAALKSGTVDTIDLVDATQLPDITSDPSLQLLTRHTLSVGLLAFSQTLKPFNDLKVREAAAYAIDKATLVNALFPNGVGTGADSVIVNNMPAYEPNATITGFDLTKAKALLQSSSCPSPCAVTFWYPDNVSRPYMLDPKGEFEAIKPTLEAAAFAVTPTHNP